MFDSFGRFQTLRLLLPERLTLNLTQHGKYFYGDFEGLLVMAHGCSYLVDEGICVIISKHFSFTYFF